MGQVEEQRYVCRICSKSCVSGKSLGGHMRVHLAQIAASKKAAVNEMECDDSDQLKESCIDQSISEEKITVKEFGDGDQSNHSLTAKTASSCKECGKEFTSLRALSGHMRCHSIKNKKEVHLCKECGRGFESMRAMFGHMKCHSKRVMKVPTVAESGESLSDFENFCPIRRKRSRIKYKGTVNPSFLGVDAGVVVSELEEEEEAARCLVMLSRGVGSFLKFDSSAEDSDDSAYFGGVVASCGSDVDIAVGKKVSEFDQLDVKFDDAGVLRVENGMKADLDLDLVCDDESCFEKKSCENGGVLEMVEGFEGEKKHMQRSGEEGRVEQEMESGSARGGSLRGAGSMRRCCSLLEMDAVAVIW